MIQGLLQSIGRVGIPVTTAVVVVLYLLGITYWSAYLGAFELGARSVGLEFDRILFPHTRTLRIALAGAFLYAVLRHIQERRTVAAEHSRHVEQMTSLIEEAGADMSNYFVINRSAFYEPVMRILGNKDYHGHLATLLDLPMEELRAAPRDLWYEWPMSQGEKAIIASLTDEDYQSLLSHVAVIGIDVRGGSTSEHLSETLDRVSELKKSLAEKTTGGDFDHLALLIAGLLAAFFGIGMAATGRYSLLVPVAIGFGVGLLAWGGANWARTITGRALTLWVIYIVVSLTQTIYGLNDANDLKAPINLHVEGDHLAAIGDLILKTDHGIYVAVASTDSVHRRATFYPASRVQLVEYLEQDDSTGVDPTDD
jgi:hypothetical protein